MDLFFKTARPEEMRHLAARGLGDVEPFRIEELDVPARYDVAQLEDVIEGLPLSPPTRAKILQLLREAQPGTHLSHDLHALTEVSRLISLLREEGVHSDIRREVSQRAVRWMHRRQKTYPVPARQVRRPDDARLIFAIAPARR